MRIELQLVEFERGSYALVPVASAPGGAGLINQLVISRFAIQSPNAADNQALLSGCGAVVPKGRPMCRIDPEGVPVSEQKIALNEQFYTLPVTFATPVQFEVSIR